MSERKREMSGKLVRKINHPDLIWTVSLWADQAQPISYSITNTGLLACVDVCVDICVYDYLLVLDKLTVCSADVLAYKLEVRWSNGELLKLCVP